MIAGPVTSRGDIGLEALVTRNLHLLEHGLTSVAADLDLADVAVTVLARDAAGAPVLVFADDGNPALPAAVRAARLHAHLAGNVWLLQRVFPHRLPAEASACLRVIVVAFRFDDLALATLRALALPDLRVLELHDWAIAGKRQWAVRPVLARPEVADGGFSVPSAMPARLAPVAAELLRWVERIDADVAASGDRFARHVVARGRPLCTIALRDGALCISLPDGQTFSLLVRDDALAAMDKVMATFEQALRGAPPAAPVSPSSVEAVSFGLDDVRRSLADAHLTRAERAALQHSDAKS